MQKLPEASDRKRGDACAKKRDHSDKKEESPSFSAAPSRVPTPRSFLLPGGGRHTPVFRRRIG